MFNVRPETLFPWFHVEPSAADEVPGFHVKPDDSAHDMLRGAAPVPVAFGKLPSTLKEHYADAAEALMQPFRPVTEQSRRFSSHSPLPTGLASFHYRRAGKFPDFNFRLESALPVPPPYPDTMPTLTPLDTQTRQRIASSESLTGPVRSFLTTDENLRSTDDVPPYTEEFKPLLDLESGEDPNVQQWPSSAMPKRPADIKTDVNAATFQHADSQPAPQVEMVNAWPQPPMYDWPDTQPSSDGRRAPWPTPMAAQPTDVPPTLSVRPIADSNFILANTGDSESPQTHLPPHDRPAGLEITITPNSSGLATGSPEQSIEQEFSRFREERQHATENYLKNLKAQSRASGIGSTTTRS